MSTTFTPSPRPPRRSRIHAAGSRRRHDDRFGGALGAAVIGTVFFEHTADGLTSALTTAMPWVTAGFLLCATLCLALPRKAVTDV